MVHCYRAGGSSVHVFACAKPCGVIWLLALCCRAISWERVARRERGGGERDRDIERERHRETGGREGETETKRETGTEMQRVSKPEGWEL